MKCTKVRYRDEIGAKLAMAKAQATGNPNRPKSERRAYRCRRCNGWHLTSQAANQQVSGGRDVG